jgi:hypothetical protein
MQQQKPINAQPVVKASRLQNLSEAILKLHTMDTNLTNAQCVGKDQSLKLI